MYKIAFQCPALIGVLERIVISFNLKNARIKYQRAMNAIFYFMIDQFMEVYIDDIVIKV